MPRANLDGVQRKEPVQQIHSKHAGRQPQAVQLGRLDEGPKALAQSPRVARAAGGARPRPGGSRSGYKAGRRTLSIQATISALFA